ncbi:MAG: tRNA epoxyqueuosine(34) reductase QueG [Rhizobiales bacterium]|nr:tRNA epoxyqueuosine(34) reductase QueG [Hyphomicrobiales bacterium]
MAIAPAYSIAVAGDRLREFVLLGHHGEMQWIEETLDRRSDPRKMWPEARSAIMFAAPYGQDIDPLARLNEKSSGVISVYALNRDYHDVIKGRLKRLAQWFARESGAEVKVFVDTAPLMEKPLAQAAGLGWQGKHTNLVSRGLGSWFFLGAILTDAELEPAAPESDRCGTCRACLDICPTKAFPAPYQLDARRCISYLTIEHKGAVDEELREGLGNRIYGCDDCLAVCPWNKFASQAQAIRDFLPRAEFVAPRLGELLALDDAGFRALFSGSPIKRIGRDRFVRNCLYAAGNSGNAALLPLVEALTQDPDPVVADAAEWALTSLRSDP